MFLLIGETHDFDGVLGLFATLEDAIAGRKEYRKEATKKNTQTTDYDRYSIFDLPVGVFDKIRHTHGYKGFDPVDSFVVRSFY